MSTYIVASTHCGAVQGFVLVAVLTCACESALCAVRGCADVCSREHPSFQQHQ